MKEGKQSILLEWVKGKEDTHIVIKEEPFEEKEVGGFEWSLRYAAPT